MDVASHTAEKKKRSISSLTAGAKAALGARPLRGFYAATGQQTSTWAPIVSHYPYHNT